jgi:urease accessory protein
MVSSRRFRGVPLARFAAVVAGALACLLPTPARAHLVTTGLGPIYDGIGHLLVSPDDLLPVVALALLAGLNGKAAGRWVLFLLPVAWVAGGLAGYWARVPPLPGVTAVAPLLLLGILVAADRRLSAALVGSLAVGLGLLLGWLNGASIASAGREALGVLGIAGAVFVVVALAASQVASLRAAWARIAVRVAGSWMAAIGLLMLGWSLSGRN